MTKGVRTVVREESGTAERGRRAASGGTDFLCAACGAGKIGGAAMSLTPECDLKVA